MDNLKPIDDYEPVNLARDVLEFILSKFPDIDPKYFGIHLCVIGRVDAGDEPPDAIGYGFRSVSVNTYPPSVLSALADAYAVTQEWWDRYRTTRRSDN